MNIYLCVSKSKGNKNGWLSITSIFQTNFHLKLGFEMMANMKKQIVYP